MEKAEIGLIGLGTMGSNLALNIAEKGTASRSSTAPAASTDAFVENAGALRDMVVPCESLAELAAAIRPPRPIIIMVQAGKPVDEQIAALRGVLSANDIIIDAGNANFRDTMRRFDELRRLGPDLHRHGRVRRRGGRAPRPVDHGRRHRSVLEARREGARPRSRPSSRASPARPGSAPTAPAISSRPSTTASNMPTCR